MKLPNIFATLLGNQERSPELERLKRENQRLRALFDEAPDGAILHDRDGSILEVNEVTVDSLGYSREELLEMEISDVEVEWEEEELEEVWEELDYGEQIKAEGMQRRRNGTTFPVEIWVSKVEVGGEPKFLALTRDISKRRDRERELEETKRRLEEAQRVGNIGHWNWDIRTGELEWSDQVFRIFGLEPGEMDPDYDSFFEHVPREERDRMEAAIEDALEKNNYDIDHRILRPSGEERVVHEKGEIEYEDGEPVRMLGTVQDITKEDRLERELRQKYEELSLLNRITRHDIRNDMNVVLGWSLELKEDLGQEVDGRVERIIEKSQHIIDLTETARDFVEVTTGEERLEAIDVSSVLEGVVQTRKRTFEEDYFVIEELPRGLEVEAGSLLSTVFRNLLNNAVQHNDKEEPRVVVSAHEEDGSVVISIADNGPGIPEAERDNVFGKGEKGLESGGTGIGLYLVGTLVGNYGGEVWIEENEPEGAVFQVRLTAA